MYKTAPAKNTPATLQYLKRGGGVFLKSHIFALMADLSTKDPKIQIQINFDFFLRILREQCYAVNNYFPIYPYHEIYEVSAEVH